jgi:hypothetical protein
MGMTATHVQKAGELEVMPTTRMPTDNDDEYRNRRKRFVHRSERGFVRTDSLEVELFLLSGRLQTKGLAGDLTADFEAPLVRYPPSCHSEADG